MNNTYDKKLNEQDKHLLIHCSNNVVRKINEKEPDWEEIYKEVKTLMDVTYTLSPYNTVFNASS